MKRRWFLMGILILVLLLASCVSGSAESGTYRGVSWDLTDGVLTLGNGDSQTMSSTAAQNSTDWPWYANRAEITSVVCSGTIRFRGSLGGMFCQCSNVASIDTSGWDVSAVTRMSAMFDGCGKLATLDVSGWHVGSVTAMGAMFRGCKSLTTIALDDWDVKNVTDTNNMFNSCSGLQTLNVSRWNTSRLSNIAGMFGGCSSLTELNVNSWDTHSFYGNAQWLFTYCSNLRSIDLSSWDLTHVSSIDTMFKSCTKLKSLNISGWDTSHITNFVNMYGDCPSLSEVTLGEKNPFVGASGASVTLPTPPASKDGIPYTRKWIRDDQSYGPFTAAELRDNYTSAMAGKWVWEEAPRWYTIQFVSSDSTSVGSMPQVSALATEDYELPENKFRLVGYVFDHWEDAAGNVYAENGIIEADTHAWNDVVVLTAKFVPKDTSIIMRNGEFSVSIVGGEEAVFDGIPAGTSYSVFEEDIPNDWVLIAQSDASGLVRSLDVSSARFVNKYQPDMATLQFSCRKLMDGQPAEADSFLFELWEGNVLLQTKSVIDGGFVQFDILEYDKTMVGLHQYVIKELAGTDDGILYDGHNEIIVVEVTVEDDDENHISHVDANVVRSEGTYPDMVFQNWTKPGILTLKKLVDDLLADHEGDEFRFRITFKQEDGLPLTDELTCMIEP